jgi:hypothetical protein
MAGAVRFKMAYTAIFDRMHTCKSEPSNRMIKFYLAPPGRIMTGCTVSVGIIFGVDDALVDVFMTIGAANADLPEAPVCSFLMTGKTGCCQVRSVEPELALIMLFNRK